MNARTRYHAVPGELSVSVYAVEFAGSENTVGLAKVLSAARSSENDVSFVALSLQDTFTCVDDTWVAERLLGAVGATPGVVTVATFDGADGPLTLRATTS